MRGLILSGFLVALPACLIPRPFKTDTAIVRSEDSQPILGETAAIEMGSQEWPLVWDPTSRQYVGGTSDMDGALRVARLAGDMYLFQGSRDLHHYLVPVRIRASGEAVPLACEGDQDLAAEYGVSARPEGEFTLLLQGDRPGILGFLLASIERCTTLLTVDEFTVPPAELSGDAAGPGHRPSQCRPCPTGPGACVMGSVRDRSGAVLSGATVRVSPLADGPTIETRASDDGAFAVVAIPPGTYEVSVGFSGFVTMTISPLRVHPGASYIFEDPFELPVAGFAEEMILLTREPLECR